MTTLSTERIIDWSEVLALTREIAVLVDLQGVNIRAESLEITNHESGVAVFLRQFNGASGAGLANELEFARCNNFLIRFSISVPVRVNSDASVDVSGAVSIATHVGDTLHLSYFHFLLVSISKALLASVESLTALSKSWDGRDTLLSNLTNWLAANCWNLGDLHGLMTTKSATE